MPLEEVKAKLQPVTLSQFFGQPRIKEDLAVAIAAAQARGEPLGHVLLCGPEGCGKRTLAAVIGNETAGRRIWGGSAHEPEGVRSLIPFLVTASISGDLHPGDVMYIDDIHRLPPVMEESLCSIMRDFALHGEVITPFTFIGATDQPNRVSPQLKRCYQHIYEFEPYDDMALGQLVQRRAEVLGMGIEDEACWELGRGAKGTIREAERLLDRARDYAEVKGEETVTLDIARWAVHGTVPASGKGEPGPDTLTWQDFEDFVAKLFRTLGYQNVRVTPRAANGGKDVVMEWADPLRGTRRLYVECKHWQAGSVGRREVQILHSAVMANPEVDEGVIVTTSSFTDAAIDYAKQVGVVQLIDREELRELMAKAGTLESST